MFALKKIYIGRYLKIKKFRKCRLLQILLFICNKRMSEGQTDKRYQKYNLLSGDISDG